MLLIEKNCVSFEQFFAQDLYWFTSAMIPESSDLSGVMRVFEIFNNHLKSVMPVVARNNENSAFFLTEPMKFLTPCMTAKRIA